MAVTTATFKQDFPQFSSTSESDIIRALTRAGLRISASIFGDLYDEAHGLLAAHLLALSGLAAQSGGVASGGIEQVRIDGFHEVRYESSSSQPKTGLNSTIYGQQFLEVQSRVVLPISIG